MSARGGFRAEVCPGGHIGPPLRGGGRFGTKGKRCENGPCQRGGTEPAPYGGPEQDSVFRTAGCAWGVASADQISFRNLGRRSGRRPLRKVYRSPSNGPMRASAPTPRGGRGNGTPGSSCPTGGRREVSSIAGAALSEAESAGIAAGQIRSLPDDLRVQHGVPGSEV